MSYQVADLLVVAHTPDGSVHRYRGAFVPDNTDPDQLKQLLEAGSVVEVESPESEAASGGSAELVISESIPVVLAWVGSDQARASAALEAENVKGDDKARASLVEKLEAIIAGQAN